MARQVQMEGNGVPAGNGAERSATEATEGVTRGRPGRRSTEERTQAVVELLSGKASIDQVARRFGVQPATVVKWRDIAVESIASGLRQGTAKSAHELELQKQQRSLERAFTDLAIRHELVQRALKERPTLPGRSPR
ncbi:MAG: transposase [Candidatus Latescibacterota bacterium]